MSPLSNIRQIFTWICICPIDKNASRREKLLRISISITILATTTAFVISSVTYLLKNLATDMVASLFAGLQTIGYSAMVYLLCIGLLIRRKINQIFIELEEFYQQIKLKSSNKECYEYLVMTNNKCENMSRIYLKFMPIASAFSVLVESIVSTILWCLLSDFKDLSHPYRIILPWSTSTPFGYLLENVFCLAAIIMYSYVNGVFLLLFISLCFHHQTFCRILEHSVNLGSSNPTKHLCSMVRFHNSAKTLFRESAKIYEPFTLILLICSMLYIACDLFLIDRQLNQPSFALFLLGIIFLFGQSNLFIYCYFGKLATESYMKMGDILYNSDWTHLPIHLQKHIHMMIQNMQQPLEYSGFGIAILNLGTFTKLMKNLFSCYMMFKKIQAK